MPWSARPDTLARVVDLVTKGMVRKGKPPSTRPDTLACGR